MLPDKVICTGALQFFWPPAALGVVITFLGSKCR